MAFELFFLAGLGCLFFFWWNQSLRNNRTLQLTYQPINANSNESLPKYEDIDPNVSLNDQNVFQTDQNVSRTDQIAPITEQNSELIDHPPNYNSLDRRNSI
jgi:hypothetical protein